MKDAKKTPTKRRRKPWPQVRFVKHKNGSTAWLVDGRVEGRGERLFYATKVEADTKAQQLRLGVKKSGTDGIASISESLRIAATECEERLNAVGATLREATDFYLNHIKKTKVPTTCSAALLELLQAKEKSGKRPSYVRALGWSLGKFAKTKGEMKMHEVTHVDIESWLNEMGFQLATRRAYIRDIGILFNFGASRGYCANNPASLIEKPTLEEDEPEIFRVFEAEALLQAAHSSPEVGLVPYLALGLFCGLRASELKALDWGEVDLEALLVEVKGRKAKTRQRRHVAISKNLCAWLKNYKKQTGPVVTPRFRKDLKNAVKVARLMLKELGHKDALLKWPKNGLRHSFASYHLAFHNDQSLTALQLGHADTTMLFAHYRNLVKPTAAKEYWSIVPEEKGAH